MGIKQHYRGMLKKNFSEFAWKDWILPLHL